MDIYRYTENLSLFVEIAAIFEQFINPWILFSLNALAVAPFILGSHSLILCVAGAMVFNFSLGAYFPTANFIALQIKGNKTGVAASLTGFIQTASAGTISFLALKLTDTGIGFDRTLGVSILSLAMMSLVVVTSIKVTQWKTGKKENRQVAEISDPGISEHINELVAVQREGKEITLDDGRKMVEFVSCSCKYP